MRKAEQIDIPPHGRDYRVRRMLKKISNRYRRHVKINEEEIGGMNTIKTIRGWMY